MSRAFPQVEMQPVYGFCHYFFHELYEMFFRGDVVGLAHVSACGGFVIAANHASFIDPVWSKNSK